MSPARPRSRAAPVTISTLSLRVCTSSPGKSLQRLHDGAVVPFDFQLIIAAGPKNNVVARAWSDSPSATTCGRRSFPWSALRDFRKSGMQPFGQRAPNPGAWRILLRVCSRHSDRELWARLEVRASSPRRPLLSRIPIRHQSHHSDRDLQPSAAARSRTVGRWNPRRFISLI